MVGASRTSPREDFLRVAASLEAAHEMSMSRYGRRHWTGLARHVARRRSPLSRLAVQSDQGTEISVAAVWARPSIDDVGNAWEEDATIRDLVARLAARRTPLDDAQKAIADVMTGSESERQKKAKLIFAGLFKTLNDERSDVMRGIERYARKQREFFRANPLHDSPAARTSRPA